MAGRILCLTSALRNSFKNLSISKQLPTNILKCDRLQNDLLKIQTPSIDSLRHASFFNKLTADQLWKGCTSVSNAGKKRGRGRTAGKKMIRDLNRGQVIGKGRANIIWPGLNAPIIRGKELVQQEKLPEDPQWEANLQKIRDSQRRVNRRFKLSSQERGWSGTKMPGRSIGEPDPIGDYKFDNFDTRVLEMKLVVVMRGNLGRQRRQSAFVVTGNRNGMGGFAMGKSIDGKAAMRKAKNRAGQKLMNIPICDGHTVYHDFFCQFGLTKIFVSKRPEGYGLVCHRAIKTICETIGIKNLHAKIEGATGVQHITKAFFLGLLQQRTYDQLAEEKGLHLVESRKDRGYYPTVVASPSECRKPEDIASNEILDFKQHVLNGRVVLRKKKYPPPYAKLHSYKIYLHRQERKRSHKDIKFDMYVQHGELRSFMTNKYPECVPGGPNKPPPINTQKM